MKRFMAIYLGSDAALARSGWDKLDEKTRNTKTAEGITAWMGWMTAHSVAVVDQGGPLGKTKSTSANGVADTKNNMTGYVIIQAESHEAAAKLFEKHPHFTIFPGDSVEIMECLPIPGQ